MEIVKAFSEPSFLIIPKELKLRPGARAGLWCGTILPIAFLIPIFREYYCDLTICYLKPIALLICSVSLYLNFFINSKLVLYAVSLFSFVPFVLIAKSSPELGYSLLMILIGTLLLAVTSYSQFCALLRKFPSSFSVGEGVIVVQGITSFIVSTTLNYGLDNNQKKVYFVGQEFLLTVCLFLILVSGIHIFQEPIGFCGLFLSVLILFTYPLLVYSLGENPVFWFLGFIFSSSTRVFLIIYWVFCSISALAIVWLYGRNNQSSVKLTVLRKYFHGVVVAIYLPGILFDQDLLFLASVIALSGFLFIESVRILKFEPFGLKLNEALSGFLDEKDQGLIILTHIYLLVGCSLPVWIHPFNRDSSVNTSLLLSSGIISLGIGDTAASIGGSLFGRTKFPFSSSKSVEGTICSITAELIFVLILNTLGGFGAPASFPWTRFIFASIITSIVEAATTQVDNLVLPLVMYISIAL